MPARSGGSDEGPERSEPSSTMKIDIQTDCQYRERYSLTTIFTTSVPLSPVIRSW